MNIIITGASSGIGQATAKKLIESNAVKNIWITGRRSSLLEKLKQELSKSSDCYIHVSTFDVQDKNDVSKFADKIKEQGFQIDVLINNAGLALGTEAIHNGDIDDWDTMIDTNIKGLLYITKYIAPIMVAQGFGHIINIGSTAGKVTYENGNVYCATKSAVDALGQSMRIDLLPYNIKVTNINPGMVSTEFSLVRMKGNNDLADSVYDGYTVLKAEDVADAINYCIFLPAHVCINDLTITCTQQANSFYKYKK